MGRLMAIVVAALIVAVVGCDDDSESTSVPGYENEMVTTPVGVFISTSAARRAGSAFMTPVTLTIEDNSTLGWEAGCVSADVTGSEITADRLMLTNGTITQDAMGCAGGSSRRQAEALTEFFASGPSWSLDVNRLTLSTDSIEAVFKRDRARF